ncbi:hypothetical protein BAUCODRAFT_280813 [Baudoinia panamericana UAMH 10762]|uniref:Uncharacterized protein n=1 Tax=Baudoinia panamericana (strain UAMH 10762) TaxID=717646 RepID=M2LDW7_BAUPA|nr:uncharacterized protein BAUCODRAFT_280813 [Baudoinia panamericana UAMH 10762]EMC92177.1 hypothetical protein BAUCODRAFT_280813 [Baudoinia panamericana UAMH 10762]
MTAIFATTVLSAASSDNAITGGGPGNYWHVEQLTLTWPTHSYTFETNITQSNPAWNPAWAGDASSAHETRQGICGGNGVFGHVQNNCAYPVYVHTSLGSNSQCPNGLDDPANPVGTYTIAPGSVYSTSIQAVIQGGGGVSMKLSTVPTIDPNNVLQVEWAQAANAQGVMQVWYDLSHLNGNPFISVPRFLQITGNANACQTLWDPAWNEQADCESSVCARQYSCSAVGDAYFYLC